MIKFSERHSKQVQRSCMLIWNPVKLVCEALLNFYYVLINQLVLSLDSKSTFSFTERVWNDDTKLVSKHS